MGSHSVIEDVFVFMKQYVMSEPTIKPIQSVRNVAIGTEIATVRSVIAAAKVAAKLMTYILTTYYYNYT